MSPLSYVFKVTVTKPVYLERKRDGLPLSKANHLTPAYRHTGINETGILTLTLKPKTFICFRVYFILTLLLSQGGAENVK